MILSSKKVLVQGVGNVGENLVKHLTEEGAIVLINDINEQKLNEVSSKYGAEIVRGDGIYDMDMDIYAPCALGATLNSNTISRLKCDIITGAANNQLLDENINGEEIKKKGIIYAPDFLINAGGLINVYSEINGYDRGKSLSRTREIYNTTLQILKKAELEDITTHKAALEIAKQRISDNK